MSETTGAADDPTQEQPTAETVSDNPPRSNSSQTPPQDASATGETTAPRPSAAHAAGQRKIAPGDLLLGTVLLASDAASAWIDERAPAEGDVMARQESSRPVLLSEAHWETTFGLADSSRARYAAIGLAVETQSQVSRTGSAFIRAGDRATSFVLKPLRQSRLLSPLRDGFNHLAEAGVLRIDRWVAIGREREMRSRAMTMATLNQAVNDSVNMLSDEPHVQVIVQEIVTGQSLGITAEAIEEVRERAVTLDIKLEQVARGALHRPPRATLPDPAFKVKIASTPRDGKLNLVGQYAGFTSRLLAFGIDVLILIFGLSIAGTLITSANQIFHIGNIFASIFGITTVPSWAAPLSAFVVAALVAAYWIVSWMLTGSSVGKAIMGIRVVGPHGDYPTFWRSLRRYIGYAVIILSLGIGFLWVLVDKRRQGWDDKLAGTFVVYSWPARPDETFLK